MRSKILGLLFFIIGFAAPFILQATFPNFLHASSVSTVSFWIGFLLILRPLNFRGKFSSYLKWARYAIWLNIVLSILLVLYFYTIIIFDKQNRFGGLSIIYYLSFVVNPIRSVFDSLVAQPSVQQAVSYTHLTLPTILRV